MTYVLYHTLLAFLGSAVTAVIFHNKKQHLIWTGFAGALGWFVFDTIATLYDEAGIGIFLGSLALGLFCEAVGRWKDTPPMTYIICALFPLVPGVTAYQTIEATVLELYSDALNYGMITIRYAIGIAMGLVVATTINQLIRKKSIDNKIN
jgi:uncharacterized membrane protein YjjB (DUF3815 family)